MMAAKRIVMLKEREAVIDGIVICTKLRRGPEPLEPYFDPLFYLHLQSSLP